MARRKWDNGKSCASRLTVISTVFRASIFIILTLSTCNP
jgi:hypothetical protein